MGNALVGLVFMGIAFYWNGHYALDKISNMELVFLVGLFTFFDGVWEMIKNLWRYLSD